MENELNKSLYCDMLYIRLFEKQLLHMFGQGLIRGTVHTCIGQEACAVGVIGALDQDKDSICSNHRGHGHFLAFTKNTKANELLLEIMGREFGICNGIGGSQHLHTKNFYSNGILGGMLPVAVGIALANKMDGSNAISLVYAGDGAMAEGVVFEGLNMAGLWKLPLLLVVEHNKIAQTTPWELGHSCPIEKKVEGFGIKTSVVDGSQVKIVREVAKRVVNEIRAEGTPQCIVLRTERLGPHSKGDDTRTKEVIDLAQEFDPIARFENEFSLDEISEMQKVCHQKIHKLLMACGVKND